MSKGWSMTNLAVLGLGAALVVFLVGVSTTLAVGHEVPTQMWSAGTAIGGALIGLLVPVPAPGGKQARSEVLKARTAAAVAAAPAAGAGAGATAKAPATTSGWLVFGLAAVFVLTLVAGVALSAGWIQPPAEFKESLHQATTVVIGLATASGTALIGIFAPS